MRRPLRLAVVVAVVGLGLAVPSPSAEAHNDACIGTAVLTTGRVLAFPPAYESTSFAFALSSTRNCVFNATATATGWLWGSCGFAGGSGVTTGGHLVEFVWVGSTLTFAGGVLGTHVIVPDVVVGESCFAGADRFLLAGSFVSRDGPAPDLLPDGVPQQLGGGPVGSTFCTSGTIVDNTSPTALTIRVQVVSPSTIWICARASAFGGRLRIDTSGGVPPLPEPVTTDGNADACHTMSGNLVPRVNPPHPTVAGSIGDPGDAHYTPYLLDAYADLDEAWLCARVGETSVRVLIRQPGLPPLFVGFDPDSGIV